jgi:hypothetical protein
MTTNPPIEILDFDKLGNSAALVVSNNEKTWFTDNFDFKQICNKLRKKVLTTGLVKRE